MTGGLINLSFLRSLGKNYEIFQQAMGEIIGSGRVVGDKSGDVYWKIGSRLVVGIPTPVSIVVVISVVSL